MLNTVTLMGRFVKEPELKNTTTGTALVNFTLAVDRDYKTGDKTVDFFDCVAFKNTAEFISNYFHKGKLAVVKGRLQTRSYEDKNGNMRNIFEVFVENIYFSGEKTEKNREKTAQNFEEIADDGSLPF